MMSDDASDLTAARVGDQEAFARLYTRHAAVVLALCRRGLSQAEAEDACQETFLRAYRKLGDVRQPEGLRSWLYAIGRRVCADRRRSAKRREHHEEQAAMNGPASLMAAHNPGETAEHSEQMDRLTVALDRLPDHERLAIHLHYLDPNPVAAATDALHLSRGGYYKLLHRAREHLAAFMREAQTI